VFGSVICLAEVWQQHIPGAQKQPSVQTGMDCQQESIDQNSFYLYHATESAYYDYYLLF
jgi:hypothetical protein